MAWKGSLFSYVSLLFVMLEAGSSVGRFNYSEVESLGGPICPSMDSCHHRRSSGRRELESTNEKNCVCDYMCDEYNDCCIDAPRFDEYLTPDTSKSAWKCNELRQFGGVYMKDTCSNDSVLREQLQALCESSDLDDFSDPLGSMPATDAQTGLTYRNYYCGLCNNAHHDLVMWTPRLECPTLTFYNNSRKNLTHEYVFQNLIYDGSSWGLYLDGDNGSLFFHDCVIDPVMPRLLESKIRLCKSQSVSKCPSDYEDDDVKTKCASYTGLRYLHSESYRNTHCALCNRVNISLLTCQPVEFREMLVFRTFEHHAFSLLLDINEEKGQNVGYEKKCEAGEIFDPFFKKCRSFTCLPGNERQGSSCVGRTQQMPPQVSTLEPLFSLLNSSDDSQPLMNTSSDNKTAVNEPEVANNVSRANFNPYGPLLTANLTGVSYNTSMLDHNSQLESEIGIFKNCLLISLEADDFVMFANKTIYVSEYDRLYEPTNYFTKDGSVLVCSHFEMESDAKFSPVMGYVTVIGLGISMLCIVLHFIAFSVVPDLRNLSGKNLVSQCVSLFLAYCCYIVAQPGFVDKSSCVVLSFLTFYFFQVSFFWMNTMAFDVWRTLKMATTELRVTSGKQWKRFTLYSIYSWAIPLLVVGLAAVAEYTDFFPEEFRPHFGQPRCWFQKRRALLCFFAVPLFVVMIANVVLFSSSSRMIIMTTNTTHKRQQNPAQKRNFKLYLRLAILMGLTWGVGLIAGYVDMDFLWYVFIVLNTLQGLFIFVAFSCSSKVFVYLRDRIAKYKKVAEFRSSNSTTNSGCHSSTALTSVISKSSSKLSTVKKATASPTNSFASNSSKRETFY